MVSIPAINKLAENLQVLSLCRNKIASLAGTWRHNRTIYANLREVHLDEYLITIVDASIMKVLPRI